MRGAEGASLASASTVALTDFYHVITGTTTVNSFSYGGAYPSLHVVRFAGVCTIGTGGNIVNAPPASVAGELLTFLYNGTDFRAIGEEATGDLTLSTGDLVISTSTKGVKAYGRSVREGEWTTPAFDAGNFTASSGSWTVDSGEVTTYAYTLIGKTMIVAFFIQTTDVSATPAALRIAIPASKVATRRMSVKCSYQDASSTWVDTGTAEVLPSGTFISVYKAAFGGANWTTTSSDNTSVYGTLMFEVN